MATRMMVIQTNKIKNLRVLAGVGWLLAFVGYGMLVYGVHWASVQLADVFNKQEQIEKLNQENKILAQKLQEFDVKVSKVATLAKSTGELSEAMAKRVALLEVKKSIKYDIPLEVGVSISMQESGYRPNIVSYNGTSYGIKQIHYNAHKEDYGIKSVKELLIPEKNIEISYKMLANNKQKAYDKSLSRAIELYYGSTRQEENVQYRKEVLDRAKKIRQYLAMN